MPGTALEAVLRRDRAIVIAALAALALLSWAYLAWLSAAPAMDHAMPSMAGHGAAMAAPAFAPWPAAESLAMLLMWSVMMAGMMAPSVAPMILIYARVARQAEERGAVFAPAGWFATGYFAAWGMFSALATALQYLLERALLVTPMMAAATPVFAGLLLVAAGLYQWSPLKHSCLVQCQSPFAFIQRHGGFRGTRGGSLALGLRHGLYCIGCCWALMALLFVGGVMNLLWIAAIGALVLAEKLVPGRLIARASGVAFILAGLAMLLGSAAGGP